MLKFLRFFFSENYIILKRHYTYSVCKQFNRIYLKCSQPVYGICAHSGSSSVQCKVFDLSQYSVRYKYSKKKSSKQDEEESDSDGEELANVEEERDSKVIKTSVNSLRVDLIIKAGLGISRNKTEALFYDSKIRVNGKKIPKKSLQLIVGDEIDVIKGFSNINPQHLVISRVIILSAAEKEENINVHLRRYKHLIIENYEGNNAYKSSLSTSD